MESLNCHAIIFFPWDLVLVENKIIWTGKQYQRDGTATISFHVLIYEFSPPLLHQSIIFHSQNRPLPDADFMNMEYEIMKVLIFIHVEYAIFML